MLSDVLKICQEKNLNILESSDELIDIKLDGNHFMRVTSQGELIIYNYIQSEQQEKFYMNSTFDYISNFIKLEKYNLV